MEIMDYLYEKAFSDGYDYALEYLFSEKKQEIKKRRIALDDDSIDTNSGIGRAALLGGISGLAGGYAGKKYADKLDREGKTDHEIERGAKKRAAIVGAGTGAVLGAGTAGLVGYRLNKVLGNGIFGELGLNKKLGLSKKASIIAGVGAGAAGLGALGGTLGAAKNTRERLRNRHALRSHLLDLEDEY